MSREARELGGQEAGKVGVVVAGGASGARWVDLVDELQLRVTAGDGGVTAATAGDGDGVCVVGVNGVVSGVRDGGRALDYWLGLEIDDSRKCPWMPWKC